MSAPIWNPPAKVANDVASVTLAGHTFAWAGMTGGAAGGILSLRVRVAGGALVELARALGRLDGVRVTSGPPIAARGDCFLVHCPGFKMVLSAPAPGDDVAQALVSRTLTPALAIPCELADALEGLMRAPSAVAAPPPAEAPPSPRSSTLRRAALQPGKTLARKKPLARKTPLGRGRSSKR
ncbi:MAG TPA: hypothetical protein VHO06_17240 [Polyangia bacterium]|nr:hypothetical protein [Polyangia bacterium]